MLVVKDVIIRRGSFKLYIPYLNVGKGELLIVLGPSGAGKTTLLKGIAGLLKLERGRIFFNNIDVTKLPPEKRGFTYVPQDYALFPHLSVWDNIAYGLRIKGLSRDEIEVRVRSVARIFGIEGLLNRYPNELSIGQKQRVAIARAVVVEPKVLLLDEPLTNIDPCMRSQARKYLKSILNKLKLTVIYATHSIVDTVVLGSRVAYLINGRLEFLGNIHEFLRTKYAKSYLDEYRVISSFID